MMLSMFTVALIALFVLTVWFETPRESVRRHAEPKNGTTPVDLPDETPAESKRAA